MLQALLSISALALYTVQSDANTLETAPCEHHVCPLGETCSPSPYNTVDDLRYQCSSKRCNNACMGDEVCAADRQGRMQCVSALNNNGALYDGFNAGGYFVPCSRHSQCNAYREPVEWYCCSSTDFRHRWHKSGAFCDEKIGACVMERWELGRLRWTFAERADQVHNTKCAMACPCCV